MDEVDYGPLEPWKNEVKRLSACCSALQAELIITLESAIVRGEKEGYDDMPEIVRWEQLTNREWV